jgi:hypothetical protein
MDFFGKGTVGLVLVLFGNQVKWFDCKNGKLVKSFIMEKEWLESPLGVLIPSTIACFLLYLQVVPIKMYW